jgi:hypothetical protein
MASRALSPLRPAHLFVLRRGKSSSTIHTESSDENETPTETRDSYFLGDFISKYSFSDSQVTDAVEVADHDNDSGIELFEAITLTRPSKPFP